MSSHARPDRGAQTGTRRIRSRSPHGGDIPRDIRSRNPRERGGARAVLLLAIAALAIALTATLSTAANPPASGKHASILDDPQVQADARRSIEAGNAGEARRDTDDARHERSLSRTRYHGASDADAFKVARDRFPELIDKPASAPFRPSAGQSVKDYFDDGQSALIATGGDQAIVESTVPLRGRTAAGDLKPVDLALETAGGHFAPKSAPVRSSLPKVLGDGFELPYDGGTLTVHAEGASGSTPRAEGDKLFYANAAHDTDLVAAALPAGAELSDVLRSAESPETLAFGFDGLPAGAELRLSADKRAAEVVQGDKRLAAIPPPSAVDADGVAVPVSIAVSGRRLELSVAHRSRDVAYPIVVDPVIETFTWTGGTNNDFNGWTYTTRLGPGSPQHTVALSTSHTGGWGNGLYTVTNGGYLYSTDEGIDRFIAPGDAYIYRADFNSVTHQVVAGANMCISYGIFNLAGNVGDSPFYVNCNNFSNWTYGECVSGTWPNCNSASGTAGNDAQLDYWAWGAATRAAFAGIKYQAGAVVYVNDRVNPTIDWSGDPPSSDWSGYSGPFAVIAQDSGLGVKTVAVSSPTSPGWTGATLNTGCNGTRADRAAGLCNNPKTLNFSTSTLPEGPQTVRATSTDAVNNSASFDYPMKVDRTAPQLTNTGTLKAAANTRIDDGRYTLHAVADDGNPRSGVQSIEVLVDGTQVAYQSQACPNGSCTMTLTPDYVFVGERYAEGKHNIKVIAIDQAGNARTDSWDVTVSSSEAGSIGPGEVNLKTGNLTVPADDASIDATGQGLAIDRKYNSRATAADGVSPFGPGWTSSLPVEGPSAQFTSLTVPDDVNPNTEVATADGNNLEFTPKTGGGYDSPPGSEDLTLTYNSSASQFELKDLEGNLTVFKQTSGAAAWMVASVRAAATNTTTNISYDASARVQYAIAPAPAGVSCSPASTALNTRGCRTLTLVYASSTTATGTAPGTWGDYTGRLAHADFTAWDPGTGAMVTNVISQYQYDSNGRLRAQWDPRISPALKTTYDYDAAGHMTNLTPPGEAGWNMTYGTIGSDPDTGRLKNVSRTGPNGTATTTVAYGVPLSGSGAPNQMGTTDVSAWGQNDKPATATAIFPADQVPADPPTSWTRATVHYLDSFGREVNVAAPGGRVATTEYDSRDDAIRTLSAANRARVLAGTATASQVDTQTTYNAEGTELQDELGPLHSVKLANGQTANARSHTHRTYDEGAPAGGPYHLPTTITVAAQVAGSDSDIRTSKIGYDGQSNLGWTLRQPTSKTADAVTGGLNLKTTTLYDATTGHETERRMPANPNGGDARAMQTIPYSAGVSSDPACSNRPEWASLPCKVQPVAQPNTSGVPNLPVTTYAYNRLNDVTSTTETVGAASRTTTNAYDTSGRPTTRSVSSSDGTSVPPITDTYNASSGEPATTSATYSDSVTRTISRVYDSLGRLTSYTDADGNLSTMTYDLLDRPATTNDGKGTQTWTYDSTTGLPTGLADSAAGSFSATYDADGELLTETLPNGLRAENTYDETRELVHRSYVKVTNCASNCTWLDFGGSRSIHDQWLSLSGTLGSQSYTYDAAGRLTRANDTPSGQGCTVRDYVYDADSNRTSQTTHAPGTGGACDPGSAGTTKVHSYDAGDRMTDASTTYDNLGRTTTLSASNSGGGSLANTYYSDSLTRSASQDGVTNTYFRDPADRLRSIQRIGGSGQTTTLHYSDSSDSVAWQTESTDGSQWSRNVDGIDADLAAVQNNTTGTKLQLTNLHGDVIGTASLDPAATGPTATFTSDEFGNPQGHSASRYEWLGSKERQTALASGAIEMGVREYVPAIGRFGQVDPVPGGSANAYDYAGADPVNNLDLNGTYCYISSTYMYSHYSARERKHYIIFRPAIKCTHSDDEWKVSLTIRRQRDIIPDKQVAGKQQRGHGSRKFVISAHCKNGNHFNGDITLNDFSTSSTQHKVKKHVEC